MVRTLSGIGSSEKFRRYDANISPRVINTSFVHTYLYGLIISKILRKIKGFKRFYILLDRKIAVCELYLIPLFMFDFLVTNTNHPEGFTRTDRTRNGAFTRCNAANTGCLFTSR